MYFKMQNWQMSVSFTELPTFVLSEKHVADMTGRKGL